jgi:glycosyltransferase involved in cell wall biosynthesis
LERDHGVEQRFVILDPYQENFYRSAVAAGQQRLADCDLVFLGGDGLGNLDRIPPADAVMATMWTTAYVAATAPEQVRRFYLIQDFEPGFYPGGSVFALAEETYRLGLYGICNTEPIHSMYTERYGGTGNWFLPAVDRDVFHPPAIPRSVVGAGSGVPGDPVRVFVYARPGHWRNCWEIAKPALEAIKGEFGEGVHLVTAGSWASPDDIGGGIEHLGLLDVRSTGDLYRRCDVGVALTVSEHPSYLPLELMACGVPVVAFDIPEAEWILRHEKTGLRARQTVEGLREQLSRMVREDELRSRCSSGALAHVNAHHSDWNAALSGVYEFLCDPAS